MTTAWSFDAAGRLSSVASTRNGTGLDSHSYVRDAVGNITQETITGSSNSTSTFGYDDLYRLSSATVASTAYSWAYDQVGNRTSQVVGGVTTTYTVDGADHLTGVNGAAVTSDADGNVLQDETGGAYTWDVRGRLVGLNKGGKAYAFQYGPDGLRLNKTVGGVLTTYLLDGGQVVTDTTNGTAAQTLYGPGTDHPLARNGEFFLPNSLGSTSLLTDGSGNAGQSYQYSPFGGLLNAPTDSNPFQFTGRENDGDGLLYCRARYYNPGWGRFASADPAGFKGGINPYVYAGDNPVGATDPSGTRTDPPWVNSLGHVVGLGLGTVLGTGGFIAGGGSASLTGGGIVVAPAAAIGLGTLGAVGGYAAGNSLVHGLYGLGSMFSSGSRGSGGGDRPDRHLIAPKDLPLPEGVGSLSAFGDLIGWGSGVGGAEAAIQNVTASSVAELEAAGVTPEMVEIYAQYYANEWFTVGNAVAEARAQLLADIYNVMVGS